MAHKLIHRHDFLRVAAHGRKAVTQTLVLQQSPCIHAPAEDVGIGFTVTKKQGNSVVRNRIRRRLREAFRHYGEEAALPGYDYVLIGRAAAADCAHAALLKDMAYAFRKLSKSPESRAP